MALYRVEAIVLRSRDMGEADRVVTLLGSEGGKVRAVARGARRPRSRLVAATQAFTRATFSLFRGRDLDTVSQAELIDSFRGLREDLEVTALAACAAEVTDGLLPEGEPQPDAYALLVQAFTALPAGGAAVLYGYVLKFLDVLGYRPRLDACVSCSGELGPAGPAAGAGDPAAAAAPGAAAASPVHFSFAQGGAVCPRCRDASAVAISRESLEAMRRLLETDLALAARLRLRAAAQREIEAALEGYATWRLERRLKAFEFLRLARGAGKGG